MPKWWGVHQSSEAEKSEMKTVEDYNKDEIDVPTEETIENIKEINI